MSVFVNSRSIPSREIMTPTRNSGHSSSREIWWQTFGEIWHKPVWEKAKEELKCVFEQLQNIKSPTV